MTLGEMQVRAFTTQLLSFIENGVLTYKDVCENLVSNWLSEDEVKEFVLKEYGELFPDDDEEEEVE